ncbi:hypothetical protein LINGRAHAP2_LOCUS6058 [Linum grandiflorum]
MAAKDGYRLRTILVHSLWMTILGLLLFRLATASSQRLVFVEMFAISGVATATAPWIMQLLVSTAIVVLYNAQVCDFTWLVRLSPPPERVAGFEFVRGREKIDDKIEYHVRLWRDAESASKTPPFLQRNRTV